MIKTFYNPGLVEEGKNEGKIEDICKFIKRRFSADPGEVREKIQRVASLELLDSLMKELFAANTLEEAQAIIDHGIARALQ
jgi:predicted regulator of amino acid metabolism with ACT domain